MFDNRAHFLKNFHLFDAQLLLHAGSCSLTTVVVVEGGVWLGSALLHYGLDGGHVGCPVPGSEEVTVVTGER